jgi:hypothetical protein
MKQLLGGIVLIFVIGILGFLYRYEIENPSSKNNSVSTNPSGAACTAEAKVCPDGSAVGRTGPNCSFAACPPPNVELTSASTTIGFVLPAGYKPNIISSDDSTYIASYVQDQNSDATTTNAASVIDIHVYQIPAGGSPSKVMLANTYFDPSQQQATTTNSFSNVTEGANTFYEVQLGRFGNQVESEYFIYEPTSVLSFTITERGVENAATGVNPNVLPQHVALQQMLATLQVSQG